jgi:hypothetical protein
MSPDPGCPRIHAGEDVTPSVYFPAQLQVIAFLGPIMRIRDFMSEKVFGGGRLTRPRVEEALPKIQDLMMLPRLSMEHIDLKATFLME